LRRLEAGVPSRLAESRCAGDVVNTGELRSKLAFSLDDEAVRLLRQAAERTRKPQSMVVREAITQYAAREETLSDDERKRLLGVVRAIRNRPSTRPAAAVDRELADVRRTRRTGWSRPGR
jgi:hypothetical protein